MNSKSYRTAIRPWLNDAIIRFVEGQLRVKGCITRKDIMSGFGVSNVTASRYLNSYRQVKPDVLVYDPSSRSYRQKDWPWSQPMITVEGIADEVLKVNTWLEQEHRRWALSVGRDPEEYSSEFSLAADKLRACVRKVRNGGR